MTRPTAGSLPGSLLDRLGGVGGLVRAIRVKLRVAIATVAILWFVAFAFAEQLVVVMARPLVDAWARRAPSEGLGQAALHFRSLLEPFWTYMSLSFWVALIAAAPVLFFQLWRVLAPKLPARHRRFGVPFSAVTGLCFAGGVVFGYFAVLPVAYDFLLSYAAKNLATMHSAVGLDGPLALKPALFLDPYLSLTMRMLVAFGLVFELPVLIALLALLGLVTHRGLWRFNRWAIVLSFVIGAVLTPGPDLVSQVLMAVPLIVLYNLSILIAFAIGRRRDASRAPVD